ncbi:hypothetical protein E2C01_037889 [Portunus trituberculatus]|uniref:Uncharacterized protein n=1 Tax=Portunus trituberculatus TaxID=210409 RepID=A0A5B7FAI5_PORTR|nr:hypothetical protein [Portunus trituberculatus]
MRSATDEAETCGDLAASSSCDPFSLCVDFTMIFTSMFPLLYCLL